jgi:hypothetical protein
VFPFKHLQETSPCKAPEKELMKSNGNKHFHHAHQNKTSGILQDISDQLQNQDLDDEDAFSDDEEEFILMTPAAKQSEEIASQSVETQVEFKQAMLDMLGDRLRKVPKHFQFRSPFELKSHRPAVPWTKALALLNKIEQDKELHWYVTILSFLSITFCTCWAFCKFHIFVIVSTDNVAVYNMDHYYKHNCFQYGT